MMVRTVIRSIHAGLVVLTLFAVLAVPAFAQGAAVRNGTAAVEAPVQVEQTKFEAVRLAMRDGYESRGLYGAADDFVIECPLQQLKDPKHPCNQFSQGGTVHLGEIDDLVLVCPVKEVLEPGHACFDRSSQIKESGPDDYVLVCPVKEVLDPSHPCAEQNRGSVKFEIPGDYVLTCPVKEVLDPSHPCAE